ncbi:MAG TPA: hypothetical protein VK753_06140 [Xanthomonadaceae bacterium]|nr:hypothetical protein [Xanthomonadaceae bacterium]
MNGVIVITAEAGRALRNGRMAPRLADVLDRSGEFHAGDRVYVVVRGHDGGQGVVAAGVIDCDASVLDSRATQRGNLEETSAVMREQDLELLWPSSR